ncbi:MAG: DUF192 domain-containing protein [Pseudomonadota bacterium]
MSSVIVRNRHGSLSLLLALCALLLGPACNAAEFAPAQLKGFPRSTLGIVRHDGRDEFKIWVADTGPRQQQGLMFVRDLPADYGMLFPLVEIRVMSMWMKNTYVALDMVYIGVDGRIAAIAANTTPLSEAIVSFPVPVQAVLELKAGECARRGIRAGDRVEHPLIADRR